MAMKLFFTAFILFAMSAQPALAVSFENQNAPTIPVLVLPPPVFAVPPADYKLQKDFSYVDRERLINPVELNKALAFYEFNFAKFNNPQFLTVIDFSKNASLKRLFQINMQNGEVLSLHVSIGKNSDPDGDGNADSFSNVPNSLQSSLGFYLTDEEYMGGNGRSLRLHGLSETNSNALARYIVVHGADYVSEEFNHAGRSHGCPAVDMKYRDLFINNILGGSLLYIFFK